MLAGLTVVRHGSPPRQSVYAGEIIPQAVCSRHGLAVGARFAWFVQILMWTFAIIAYPISKILDYLLGSEHTVRLLLSVLQSCRPGECHQALIVRCTRHCVVVGRHAV